MNILTKKKGISTEDRLSLLIAMPVILDKINRTLVMNLSRFKRRYRREWRALKTS
jgi:hypothetical protein